MACGPAGPREAPPPARPDVLPGSLRAEGEAVFRREQCDRCHTTFDAPAPRGDVPLPVPHIPQPSDSRVGPDLGLEGHRRSDDWHAAHLYAPEVMVPGTRMPASRHLFVVGGALPPRLNRDGRALVAWLQGLGRSRRDVWSEFRARDPEIPPPAERPPEDRRARGETLYASWCVPCHGIAGDGRGPAAALLAVPPRNLAAGDFRFRSTPLGTPASDADLFRVLTLGSGTGAAMPSFAFLDPEDRWALVRAVRDFSPATRGAALDAEVPGTRPSGAETAARTAAETAAKDHAAGDRAVAATRGGRLYAAWGCAACHGPDGAGKEMAGAPPSEDDATEPRAPAAGAGPVVRASDLRHACARRGGGSSAAFERALRFGTGPVMPSFAPVLDGEPGAVEAILAWLATRDPDAPAPEVLSESGR